MFTYYSDILEIKNRLDKLESGEVEVKFTRLSETAIVPTYQKDGDAGLDLSADVSYTLRGGETVAIPTGIAIELPEGYEAQIRTRSGLSIKGIVVANSPGTIDAGFRGELCVILRNTNGIAYVAAKGNRIAQLVITRVAKVALKEVSELSETDRGTCGFGSSGI